MLGHPTCIGEGSLTPIFDKGNVIMNKYVFVVTVILAVIFVPFANIWALNTLFGLTIPYGWETWLAMFMVHWFFYSSTAAARLK